MFGFLRASKKVSKADAEELKILEDLKKSLGDESPQTTNLKNRLRIIDLEDKITTIEKQIRKLKSSLPILTKHKKLKSNKKKEQ